MNPDNSVVVLLQPAGEQGTEINRGLLTEGRRIARHLGAGLSALVIGEPSENPDSLKSCGLGKLYRVHGRGLSDYSGEVYSRAIADALKKLSFELLLMAHTDRGRELAPRVAYLLDTAAVTGCVDIRVRNRRLFYVRSMYGGQLEQEVSYAGRMHQVVSIRPDVLSQREAEISEPFQVFDFPIEIPSDLRGSKTLEIIEPDFTAMDIQHAKRIVGAGSGCASPKLASLAEELALLLEGSIAATRPLVDDGYLPREKMVGQTGKTVSPGLYLALGISGSPHHVAGIQKSGTILSVNRDPAAPIFGISDAGFICDLEILLPGLIARIKRYKDKSA